MHITFKTVALLLAVAAILAYCGNSQYQNHTREKEREAQGKRDTQAMVESLHKLAAIHNAKVGWAKELVGEKTVRISPIMSAELQQVWLTATPILFVGTLKDISKNADGSYQVSLEYDSVSEKYLFISSEIYFSARCSAELALPLLKMGRDTSRLGMFADAAVVGVVSGVDSKQVRDNEGNEISQLTGTASCLGTLPLHRILPSNWFSSPSGK
jgi:hypothetical protein